MDEDGNYTGSSGLQQSYLSGYYLITKISHKIDGSGFNTTLDIARYPLGDEPKVFVSPVSVATRKSLGVA
jgi:hypothetical protein